MDLKVEQFLLNLPQPKQQHAILLREIILSASDAVTDSIKWNQLTFSLGKKSFAFIYTYPHVEYINMGFFFATSLTDPKQLFQGTGKGMRHIKIYSDKDIPGLQVKQWAKESVALILKNRV